MDASSDRGARRRLRGQSLVEFALVTPILLLIFAGAADLGRAFYAYVAIENAAKEGALFGSRSPLCDDAGTGCANPNNVVWHVRNELKEQGIRNPNGSELVPTVQCLAPNGSARNLRDCAEGDTYAVELSYPFRLLTPILGSVVGDLDLRSVSRAVVLNLAFDPSPGASIQKLVSPTGAVNDADIIAKCLEPDEHDADGFYRNPCLDTSTADPSDRLTLRFEEGTPIQYRITINNTGATNITSISVVDSRGSTGCSWPSSLAVGGSHQCDYTRTAPSVSGSGNSMDYANTATIDTAQTLPTTDGVTVTVERPPARLRILKWVSSFREGDDGDGEPSFGTDDDITVSTNSIIDEAEVWYKVILRNTGGRTATGIDIDDTNGPLPYGRNNSTAECSSQPSTLAAGAVWECRYREDFDSGSPATTNNTVDVTASNVIPDNDDDATATVRRTSCTGSNRVVPDLIGLDKGDALDAWEDAGFQRNRLDTWSGNNSSDVETQDRQAYSCVPSSSSMDVTRTETP
ncbi:MAG TPA: TadE family protein [Candidatus Limnocylindrales bacterium]